MRVKWLLIIACVSEKCVSLRQGLGRSVDVEQPTNICTSCYQNGVTCHWIPTSRVWLLTHTVPLLAFAKPSPTICALGLAVQRQRWGGHWWGYIDHTQSVNCDCGEPQTMAHLLLSATWWALLPEDIITARERANGGPRNGNKLCEGHERREEVDGWPTFSCSLLTHSIGYPI